MVELELPPPPPAMPARGRRTDMTVDCGIPTASIWETNLGGVEAQMYEGSGDEGVRRSWDQLILGASALHHSIPEAGGRPQEGNTHFPLSHTTTTHAHLILSAAAACSVARTEWVAATSAIAEISAEWSCSVCFRRRLEGESGVKRRMRQDRL